MWKTRERQPETTAPSDSPKGASMWHTLTADDAAERLDVNRNAGLSDEEARQRLNRYGANRLYQEKHEPFWEPFAEALREPLILLLLVTGVLYAIWGELLDAVVIFAVILTLVAVEVFNEQRAKRAIRALRELSEPTAAVRRNGQYMAIPAEDIVPGDILLLEAGRRVPADARLLEAHSLAADEAALTGEAVPVDKDASVTLTAATVLAERNNLIFAGTTMTRGRGTAVVFATGSTTELGRIAALAGRVKPPRTPLQKAMRELSRHLTWLALGFSILVPLLGILSGQSPQQMLLTGLSLAFATIPEELPIIITMVLALGGYRLSRQRAIVKQLQAVETLGNVTVIATDKTGTLTENRMTVHRIVPEAEKQGIIEIGVICNQAVASHGTFVGDPLETALLQAAREAGLNVGELRQKYPLQEEFTFDNIRQRMSVVYQRNERLRLRSKARRKPF